MKDKVKDMGGGGKILRVGNEKQENDGKHDKRRKGDVEEKAER